MTSKVADHLSILLADFQTLSLKTQNFHWHVKGPHFQMQHEFFGDMYEEVSGSIDDLAERIRALECDAPGTFEELLKLRTLEDGDKNLAPRDMISALLKDYGQVVAFMKKAIPVFQEEGDESSADMLIGYVTTFEKRMWMLKSHLV